MPLRNAELTKHAWLQFMKRWEGEPPACYRTELDRIMAGATKEDLGSAATIRALNNGCVPARYFTSGNWRIVTDEEVTTIMTIERPYHKGRQAHGRIKDKRRYGKR